METLFMNPSRKGETAMLFFILFFLSYSAVFADVHIIQCTINDLSVVTPKQFSADVGDTLVWRGNFKDYPLRSLSVPRKAAKWNVVSGAEFLYVITEPGTYAYWNENPANGPRSSYFIVPWPPVQGEKAAEAEQSLEFMDLVTDSTVKDGQAVCYKVTQAQAHKLAIFNDDGKRVAMLFDGFRAPGTYCEPLPIGKLTPGYYQCRLEGRVIDIKSLRLERIKPRNQEDSTIALYREEK